VAVSRTQGGRPGRPGDHQHALRVSQSAVDKYVSSIFTKLDLPPTDTENRRVLAVLKFLRM